MLRGIDWSDCRFGTTAAISMGWGMDLVQLDRAGAQLVSQRFSASDLVPSLCSQSRKGKSVCAQLQYSLVGIWGKHPVDSRVSVELSAEQSDSFRVVGTNN